MNPGGHDAFVTTRWTRVLAACGDSESARGALAELCSAYYGPVVAFLEKTGCGDDEPREVAHEFFASLLSRDGIDGVDRSRGRFRSYLLGAVKHHVANRRLKASREKRGGNVGHQALDPSTDTEADVPIAVPLTAGDAWFDRAWALALVERALAVLAEEADADGTTREFAELKAWLSWDAAPGSQAAAAARLGINEGALKVAVHRLRRRFRELLRAEIAQTLPDATDVDDEMRYLADVLGSQ